MVGYSSKSCLYPGRKQLNFPSSLSQCVSPWGRTLYSSTRNRSAKLSCSADGTRRSISCPTSGSESNDFIATKWTPCLVKTSLLIVQIEGLSDVFLSVIDDITRNKEE